MKSVVGSVAYLDRECGTCVQEEESAEGNVSPLPQATLAPREEREFRGSEILVVRVCLARKWPVLLAPPLAKSRSVYVCVRCWATIDEERGSSPESKQPVTPGNQGDPVSFCREEKGKVNEF